MIVVERTCGQQSALNLALLNHVAQYGKVSYAVLFDQFGDASCSPVRAHARFSKKMEYMLYTEQLASTGRGHDRVFTLGAMAGKKGRAIAWNDRPHARPKAAPERTAAESCDAPAFALSPSRLTATVLPTRSPALRPGALDFKSVASRGFAC